MCMYMCVRESFFFLVLFRPSLVNRSFDMSAVHLPRIDDHCWQRKGDEMTQFTIDAVNQSIDCVSVQITSVREKHSTVLALSRFLKEYQPMRSITSYGEVIMCECGSCSRYRTVPRSAEGDVKENNVTTFSRCEQEIQRQVSDGLISRRRLTEYTRRLFENESTFDPALFSAMQLEDRDKRVRRVNKTKRVTYNSRKAEDL